MFSPAFQSPALAFANLPTLWADYKLTHDIAYGPESWQKMDLYQPAQSSKKSFPVIMFLYGGGWTSGQKEQYRFVADILTDHGYIVVIPDYGKYPNVKFPAFVEDIALASSWLHTNLDKYQADRTDIHILSHSAGAHIGALLIADQSYLSRHRLQPSFFKSFVGMAGPYHFTPKEPVYRSIFGPPDLYPQMQVGHFINGEEPPMFLLHGEKDTTVGLFNLERVLDAVLSHNGKIKVKTYADLNHKTLIGSFSKMIPLGQDLVHDVLDFLND
jgi:acetyl esterase/lipase